MRRAIVLAGLLALAACSTPQDAPPPDPPAPSQPAPPPPPSTPAPAADACDARSHQNLVGRPRTEIPVPVRPNLQRVLCTTCPMTMDYNQNRLNFLFDASTGIIKEVRCG